MRLILRTMLAVMAIIVGTQWAVADPATPPAAPLPGSGPEIRLYAMSCGVFHIADMKDFADDHTLDGKSATLADTCYLVRHPGGDLIWDTGLPDSMASNPPDSRATVPVTLQSQLAEIGVKPQQIKFISISHSHHDHTGNLSYFSGKPTWLVEKREYDWMRKKYPNDFAWLAHNPKIVLNGDHDVFGDGTVRIVYLPGHTPGHTALLVKLRNFGYVFLTGDLYHTRENRTLRRVPTFNTDRAETVKSMDRFEAIAKHFNAKVVIQHSKEDFETLPKFPAYLD